MKTFPKYYLFDYIWYIGEALRKKVAVHQAEV